MHYSFQLSVLCIQFIVRLQISVVYWSVLVYETIQKTKRYSFASIIRCEIMKPLTLQIFLILFKYNSGQDQLEADCKLTTVTKQVAADVSSVDKGPMLKASYPSFMHNT